MNTEPRTAADNPPNDFLIGEWTFYASVFRLERGQESVKLEPRVAELLSCLAECAGSPVSRDTLMEKVWPGMVVGDEALTNAINKLRKAFGDDRQNPRVIETIPKAGYRLIATVIPCGTHDQQNAAPRIDANQSRKGQLKTWHHWVYLQPVVIGLVVIVMLVGLWMVNPFKVDQPANPEKTAEVTVGSSIAVLPFDNLSNDPEQEYFADGVTDDIITHLAKNSSLKVIARDSSFFYKETSLDIAEIADKLNVEYILQGSIRRVEDQLVINAQLVNTVAGSLIWAEQYAGKVQELFSVENDISRNVTRTLSSKQSIEGYYPAEIPTQHTRAHEYLLLGRYEFYKFGSKAENVRAQDLFRETIALDPEYALAYALLGWTYDFEAMNGWADDRSASLKKAEEHASKAIALQPELALSYFVRGLSYRELGHAIRALGEVEKALKYDPNNANARVLLATLLYYDGRPEEGIELIREAMELNPHHPYNYEFHLGQAYFILRQYDQAISAFRRGLESNPKAERLHVWLAASFAYLGDIEGAEWEAEQILLTNPGFSIARIEDAFPFQDPDDIKRFTEGLRMAGLN